MTPSSEGKLARPTERPRLSYRIQRRLGRTKLVRWLLTGVDPRRLRHIPPLPTFLKQWNGSQPSIGSRSLVVPTVPDALLSAAGTRRDGAAENAAFEDVPLYRFNDLYPEISAIRTTAGTEWISRLPVLPLAGRVRHGIDCAATKRLATHASERTVEMSPESLTSALKQRAAEIGLSAIGVAKLDRKYIYEPFLKEDLGSRVVVCLLEMNWAATQSAPSARHERGALQAINQLGDLCRQLAEYLSDLGYKAEWPILAEGRGISIHFAVEAGLGQLGLNGQLLTPFAGSRCRLMLLHTNAPLVFDEPRDYGIPKICDACKVCVRRCPSGAIPSERKMYRGVLKAKIKTERCYPMVVQADGCAVCLKVCPVQRYGLPAVLDEFSKTGRVLGKDTDELEGYKWPVDGRHYGPGEKPRSAVTTESLHPGGYIHDPTRRRPLTPSQHGAIRNERVLDADM